MPDIAVYVFAQPAFVTQPPSAVQRNLLAETVIHKDYQKPVMGSFSLWSLSRKQPLYSKLDLSGLCINRMLPNCPNWPIYRLKSAKGEGVHAVSVLKCDVVRYILQSFTALLEGWDIVRCYSSHPLKISVTLIKLRSWIHLDKGIRMNDIAYCNDAA